MSGRGTSTTTSGDAQARAITGETDSMVNQGYADSVKNFITEAGPESGMDLDMWIPYLEVERDLLSGNVFEAKEKLENLNPEILDKDLKLLCVLLLQEFIELIRTGKVAEALEFSQESLAPVIKKNPSFFEEFAQITSLLSFKDDPDSPAAKFLDILWLSKTVNEVKEAIFRSQCHGEKGTVLIGIICNGFLILAADGFGTVNNVVKQKKRNKLHWLYDDVYVGASGYTKHYGKVIEQVRKKCAKKPPASVAAIADLMCMYSDCIRDAYCGFILGGKLNGSESEMFKIVEDIYAFGGKGFQSTRITNFTVVGSDEGVSWAERHLREHTDEISQYAQDQPRMALLVRDTIARAARHDPSIGGKFKILSVFDNGEHRNQRSRPLDPTDPNTGYGPLEDTATEPVGYPRTQPLE